MFLERYRRDRDPVDLATARRLLAWVRRPGRCRFGRSGKLAVRPETRAPGRPRASSSESPGSHGSTCRPPAPPATPPIAGVRAGPEAGCGASPSATGPGKSCPAISAPPQHVGLDSGAAGIGWVLEDLARAWHRHGRQPLCRAHGARRAPQRRAPRPARGCWYENKTKKERRLRAEPSWHWGTAGIAAFAARLAGWAALNPAGLPN